MPTLPDLAALSTSSFWVLAGGLLSFLLIATVIGRLVAWRVGSGNATVRNLIERINAWWILVAVALPVLAAGPMWTIALFALLSVLTLREFLALTPTRSGDRLVIAAAFGLAIPLQYGLIAIDWYGLFAILLPVYGLFLLSALATLAQDTEHFLERISKVQWAVMVCVYGISHAPALLVLDIPGYDAGNGVLLLFFLLIAQISDVMQYVCGKLFGRHKLAPILSPNKTVEGLVGGGLLASGLGAALHGFTPFDVRQAALLSLAIVIGGFVGGLVLSAVKRSLHAKDWGSSIPGHGGVLDRLDSIAFSAPIFFHLTRYWFTP
ncbi:phosphatidate cytidylyltransferase [Roseateles chitinivorans]|uniref:phosphatidate cytidylyltransferase n=1 Tax=Roseateles chitinivorans TaxID=2917965 RepID=UPI003D66FD82